MTINKKFGLIFLVLVVLPVAMFVFQDSFLDLDSQDNNQLNNVLLSVAIIGCGVIFYKNKKLENAKNFWYVISITISILLISIIYIGNSISNFGF